jgi:hypothetical protein
VSRRTALLAVLLLLAGAWAQEVVLYDATASAAAFVASDTLTLHLWSGEPIAYLERDPVGDSFSVYSPYGAHLGWFDEGFLWDHEGRIVAFTEGALEVAVRAPPRGENRFAQLPLLKRPREEAPLRPLWRYTWSQQELACLIGRC